MLTKQHIGVYTLALAKKLSLSGNEKLLDSKLQEEIPFVVLPDAIRMYVGARQAGHFEQTPDGTDVGWMIYPSEEELRSLTSENATKIIKHYVPEGFKPCVIGEQSSIKEFTLRNWSHKHFASLRCHLIQDCILDEVLRTYLIDHTNRFKDSFTVLNNETMEIDGQTLRDQVSKFEELGFLKLAGAVYNSTGILLNQAWFEQNVWPALERVYPKDLAQNTYKYMAISESQNQRICKKNFDLTDSEKKSVFISQDLDKVLDVLYSNAYIQTYYEL